MLRKLYREFLYVPKYGHMSDKVFRTRISLSALTIALCCIVLCSTTFAWFNDKQSANVSAIQTAEYSLDIFINGEKRGTATANRDFTYTLEKSANGAYLVSLSANGTAQNGYCKFTAGGEDYWTYPICKDGSLNFSIVASEGDTITFSAIWGEPPQEQLIDGQEKNSVTLNSVYKTPDSDKKTEATEETTKSTEESTTAPPTEASEESTEDETVTTDATTAPTDAPTTAPSDEPTEDDATDATEESTTEPSEGADDAGEDEPVPSEDQTEDATTETEPESTAPDESTTSDESTEPKDATAETSDTPQESTAETSEESTVDP